MARCEAAKERVDETPYQVEIPTGQYGHKVFTFDIGETNFSEEKVYGTTSPDIYEHDPFQRYERQ